MRITRRQLLLRGATGAAGLAAAGAAIAACGAAAPPSGPASGPGQSLVGKELLPSSRVPVGGGTVLPSDVLVVTQPTQGTFKVFSAKCTHMGCTVNQVSDGVIRCPCHGSQFRVADGTVAHGPASIPLPEGGVQVQSGQVVLTRAPASS